MGCCASEAFEEPIITPKNFEEQNPQDEKEISQQLLQPFGQRNSARDRRMKKKELTKREIRRRKSRIMCRKKHRQRKSKTRQTRSSQFLYISPKKLDRIMTIKEFLYQPQSIQIHDFVKILTFGIPLKQWVSKEDKFDMDAVSWGSQGCIKILQRINDLNEFQIKNLLRQHPLLEKLVDNLTKLKESKDLVF